LDEADKRARELAVELFDSLPDSNPWKKGFKPDEEDMDLLSVLGIADIQLPEAAIKVLTFIWRYRDISRPVIALQERGSLLPIPIKVMANDQNHGAVSVMILKALGIAELLEPETWDIISYVIENHNLERPESWSMIAQTDPATADLMDLPVFTESDQAEGSFAQLVFDMLRDYDRLARLKNARLLLTSEDERDGLALRSGLKQEGAILPANLLDDFEAHGVGTEIGSLEGLMLMQLAEVFRINFEETMLQLLASQVLGLFEDYFNFHLPGYERQRIFTAMAQLQDKWLKDATPAALSG